MFDYAHLVSWALLVAGWAVIHRIARHNRKMTERTRIINEKTDLLDEVGKIVEATWGHPDVAEIDDGDILKYSMDAIWIIEKIRKRYAELEDMDSKKNREYSSLAGKLRQSVTLDMDCLKQLDESERGLRYSSIKEICGRLEGLPKKKY